MSSKVVWALIFVRKTLRKWWHDAASDLASGDFRGLSATTDCDPETMAGHMTPGVWRLTSLCLIYLVKKYHVSCRSHCSFRNRSTTRKSSYPRVARLVDRKFQRKLPYSSVETMIFCRCSLNKSQWDKQFEEFPIISRLPANGLHSELCKQAHKHNQIDWFKGKSQETMVFSVNHIYICYIYMDIIYIYMMRNICM